jgi:hypothetical protein
MIYKKNRSKLNFKRKYNIKFISPSAVPLYRSSARKNQKLMSVHGTAWQTPSKAEMVYGKGKSNNPHKKKQSRGKRKPREEEGETTNG